jgi:hypothetical protein
MFTVEVPSEVRISSRWAEDITAYIIVLIDAIFIAVWNKKV